MNFTSFIDQFNQYNPALIEAIKQGFFTILESKLGDEYFLKQGDRIIRYNKQRTSYQTGIFIKYLNKPNLINPKRAIIHIDGMKNPIDEWLYNIEPLNNGNLIESVKQVYNSIFESDNVINVRGIANLVSLFENPEIPLETKTETFLAVLAKTHGYYWAGLGEANALIKRLPTNISKQLIDAVEETGELHPARIKSFRSQIQLDVTDSMLPKTLNESITTDNYIDSELILYHGTDNEIKENRFKTPLWLISDKNEAIEYGDTLYQISVKLNNPYISSHKEKYELGDNRLISKALRLHHDSIVLPVNNDFYELHIYDEAKYTVVIILDKQCITNVKLVNELTKLNESVEDYKGEHNAPDADNGMPIYNLTGIYPDDIYSPVGAKHYGDNSGDSIDMESINIIQSLRNKPKSKIKVYRAVPDFNKDINDKIKSLLYIITYYNMFNFFPLNNKIVNDYTKKYYIEDEGYTIGYDEMKLKVLQEISDDIEKLNNQKIKSISINNGDWVTINRRYAVEHGQSNLNNKYKILTKTVPASTLYTDGNSIHEWGYNE